MTTAVDSAAPATFVVEPDRRARRLHVSMLAAGVAIFALLYYPQSLLPSLGSTFGLTAAAASLAVSCATGALAVGVLAASGVAERVGRTRAMRVGLIGACVLTLATVAATQWWEVLLLRTLVGAALAGVVATAIGHIGAEADGRQLSTAMGLYIGGTCLGGVVGRIAPGVVVGFASWRIAVLAVGLLATVAVTVFAVWVPSTSSRPTGRDTTRPRHELGAIAQLVRDPVVRRLCLIGFCLMGGYVACLNYVAYQLTGPPFALPVAVAALVFVVAAVGIVSSPLAGRLADRFTSRAVAGTSIALMIAGVVLTLTHSLAPFVIGLTVFTAAFFAAHSVVNSWLSQRAGEQRSMAAALYLTSYYVGSSVAGSLIGLAHQTAGWIGTVGAIAALCFVALITTVITRTASGRRGTR